MASLVSRILCWIYDGRLHQELWTFGDGLYNSSHRILRRLDPIGISSEYAVANHTVTSSRVAPLPMIIKEWVTDGFHSMRKKDGLAMASVGTVRVIRGKDHEEELDDAVLEPETVAEKVVEGEETKKKGKQA
eukprot:scaffold23675_cov108-Cylindrotheca_fusiformis.AAC.1